MIKSIILTECDQDSNFHRKWSRASFWQDMNVIFNFASIPLITLTARSFRPYVWEYFSALSGFAGPCLRIPRCSRCSCLDCGEWDIDDDDGDDYDYRWLIIHLPVWWVLFTALTTATAIDTAGEKSEQASWDKHRLSFWWWKWFRSFYVYHE